MTLPDELAGATASELAARLMACPEARPLWADGGDGPATPFAPRGHVLAAHPSRLESLRVETLPPGGLVDWLRARLPIPDATAPAAPLVAVALAYDAGRGLERTPATAVEDPPLPDVVLATYPAFLRAPSATGPWRLFATDAAAADRLLSALTRPGAAPGAPVGGPPPVLPRGAALRSSMDRAAHRDALTRVKAQIAAGEIYQANIARRLEAPHDPAATPALHAALRARSGAAFGALWAWGDGLWLASSSPECLFTFEPTRREVHSYPIKGTRRRADAPQEDARLAAELAADPKDRAEHVMIVDLVRNDLGRVAVVGSVEVARLFDRMRLPTVHHLVSDVRATLAPDRDLADLIAALFPGGSITGAPKIAAMAAIEAAEGLRRGMYTGSLGLVFGDGEARFNILIRTCVAADGRLFYQTGGGIVADSDPRSEWDETEAKALALRRALADG